MGWWMSGLACVWGCGGLRAVQRRDTLPWFNRLTSSPIDSLFLPLTVLVEMVYNSC